MRGVRNDEPRDADGSRNARGEDERPCSLHGRIGMHLRGNTSGEIGTELYGYDFAGITLPNFCAWRKSGPGMMQHAGMIGQPAARRLDATQVLHVLNMQ